jgi:preprotein translocase subunit SecB
MSKLKTIAAEEIKAETILPTVKLNGQYIKQLSFDNPQAPASFLSVTEAPRIEISINFDTKEVQENIHEVTLSIAANAKISENQLYAIKLAYSGLFTFANVPEDEKEKILSIHCTTLLFPYARSIISETTKDAGFQPLMLEPMDFNALHHNSIAREGAANA